MDKSTLTPFGTIRTRPSLESVFDSEDELSYKAKKGAVGTALLFQIIDHDKILMFFASQGEFESSSSLMYDNANLILLPSLLFPD